MMIASKHRQRARDALSGHWGMAILVALIASILGAATSGGGSLSMNFDPDQETLAKLPPAALNIFLLVLRPLATLNFALGLITLVFGGVITVGYCTYRLNLQDGKPAELRDLFAHMGIFAKAFFMRLMTILFTLLWTLLLIVPGIMASYSYSMAPFILAENPELSGMDAIRQSKELMYGHRYRLFCLDLSFIGWNLLSALTFGLVGLYVRPYHSQSHASFYRELVEPAQMTESEEAL